MELSNIDVNVDVGLEVGVHVDIGVCVHVDNADGGGCYDDRYEHGGSARNGAELFVAQRARRTCRLGRYHEENLVGRLLEDLHIKICRKRCIGIERLQLSLENSPWG